MITQSELKELLHYDKDTGVFTLKKSTSIRNRKMVGKKVGSLHINGKLKYLIIGINYKKYLLHRLAWLYMTGELPLDEIEFIDNDGTNLRWGNLRQCTHSENHKNTYLPENNSSGIIGVSWSNAKRKWLSQIKSCGVRYNLGVHENIFDAACARKSAEIKYGFHENHGSDRPLYRK